MKKSTDLTGKKFGKLTVTQYSEATDQGSVWLCQCECGKQTKASTGALNRGKRVSCGCIHVGKNSSRFQGHEDIGGSYWSQVKAGAKRRNIPFDITIEEAWILFEKTGSKMCIERNSNISFVFGYLQI